MNDDVVNKVHWSFWVVSIFMLTWNVLGCINIFVQMNPEMVSSYRETEQAIIQGRPLWATVGFAIAVFLIWYSRYVKGKGWLTPGSRCERYE